MVNNELFKLSLVPSMNPLSLEYQQWWKAEKRKCIEGVWQSGKYMPGPLYFYINFWHIELNKTVHTKTKSLAKPFLRDLEWEKGLVYVEAKGFSGFSLDTEITCLRWFEARGHGYKNIKTGEWLHPLDEGDANYDTNKDYKRYTYEPARTYLRKIQKTNLGKPEYMNNARNIVDIESRESGKSFMASALIGHNFLFDGATDYDEYLKARAEGLPMKSQTLVGAIEAFYSKGLMAKVALGFDNLEGGITFGNSYYPSPILPYYEGSFQPGKELKQQKEIKIKNTWVTKGTRSTIWHRTFKDNPLAANGIRFSFGVLEEVGFMGNLLETLGSLKECTMVSGEKFGVILMTGTGGDMDGGATEAVKEVFYRPTDYDCLAFEDQWESKGKIGYFVPKYMAYNDQKDDQGNTIMDKAKFKWQTAHDIEQAANDKRVYTQFLQNSPGKPSDAFLISGGSILPVADLKAHLADLETKPKNHPIPKRGELFISTLGTIEFALDTSNKLREAPYPVKNSNDNTGCVTIYEFPEDLNPRWFRYIAATDPYAQDKGGDSLGSTFIYKRSVDGSFDGDILVAEYTGRPNSMKEYNEGVRRLCMYYNAVNLYENMYVNLKEHFENNKSLHLLADTPKFMKATANSTVSRGKGLHRTKDIANELEVYLRDWLLETNPNGKLNLQCIPSVELLKELIAFNADGNFDRVIALELVIAYKIELTKQAVIQREKKVSDAFFQRKLFT